MKPTQHDAHVERWRWYTERLEALNRPRVPTPNVERYAVTRRTRKGALVYWSRRHGWTDNVSLAARYTLYEARTVRNVKEDENPSAIHDIEEIE